MIKISRAVIVEGKYDKIKLSNFLDTLIITTEGFGIYKNREKLELIRRLAKTRGIVILTDSDAAGFQIRSYLGGCVREGEVCNAYIPDIIGKERRKAAPSKEQKLGVEGMEEQVLMEALTRAGVFCEQSRPEPESARQLSKADLYEFGLYGRPDSREKRCRLQRELGLPERLSANDLVKFVNGFYSFSEFEAQMKKISEKVDFFTP